MYRIAASIFLVASLLTSMTGCMDDVKRMSGMSTMDAEDMKVPRLMVEARGVSYGGIIGQTVVLPVSQTKIALEKDPLVTEFEIVNVELVKVDLGLALMFEFTEKGARELYRGSVTNKGSRVVLTVNGNAIGAQRFGSAVSDGKWYTFVEVDDDELGELVLDMRESLFEVHSTR